MNGPAKLRYSITLAIGQSWGLEQFDNIVYLMISQFWGIFGHRVAAARGAGWLREELAKQTAMQLRQLAGTAGVQQREAGRNMSKRSC